MNNNDILRRMRYIFDMNDDTVIKLFEQAGRPTTRAEISDWLKKEDDENFKSIVDKDFSAFLNGFIIEKRGRKDDKPIQNEKSLNNNTIFRKLKIALNYRDEDILELFDLANLRVSKHEISAIFRKPDQKQYRVCKDQFLRNFLVGMQKKIRG